MPKKTTSKTKVPPKPKTPTKRRAPKERQIAPVPDAAEQVAPDTSREDEIGAEMAAATMELSRLQGERLLIETKLAAHTGIFGSGFLKMRDPKNEQLLLDIDALIAEQERNYSESRKTLNSLKEMIAS